MRCLGLIAATLGACSGRGNHKNIFTDAGVEWKEYRYFDKSTVGLAFEGMLEDIKAAPEGSVIVLHGARSRAPHWGLTPCTAPGNRPGRVRCACTVGRWRRVLSS